MDLEKVWLSNAYSGMSRRQFLAQMTAAGATIAGFAIASKAVAGEIITTPTDGLLAADGKVTVGIFSSRSTRRGRPPPANTPS